MLKLRKKQSTGKIYLAFLICMGLIVSLFAARVVTESEVTPLTDGQILLSAEEYSFGAVYDRNDKLIVKGSDDGLVWSDEETKAAFEDVLGIDIEASLNSKTTICGNCPWLYGTEDNRFTLYDLMHPASTREGGSVRLAIDQNIQKYVNNVINSHGYEDAYVMVSDYQTGEIIAVYGNVLRDEMHPGSTMKPIIAAAVLSIDSELKDYTYTCTPTNHNFMTDEGSYRINCSGGTSHGEMNMTDALAYSCNGYFISLLQQVDKQKMLDELQIWGFDSSISYSEFMYWDHTFLSSSEKEGDYLLGAIGQANVYITPAGLNFCTNALLNHGVLQEPIWFTDKQTSQRAEWVSADTDRESRKMCDSEVADEVIDMMLEVTAKGTGKSFYMPGFAAKTGTAEKQDENGNTSDLYTVWTTGGLIDDTTPYSITVCLDNVSTDIVGADAGKIAQEILTYITTEGGQ